MKNIALMASAGASQPFYTRLTATSTSIGEHSTALMWRSSTMPDTPLTPTGRYFTEHFLDMRPHDIISIEQEAALAHIDALTAAVVPVVRAYLANDEKGLQGALADLSAESILRGEQ
jgi:hypothetical protein